MKVVTIISRLKKSAEECVAVAVDREDLAEFVSESDRAGWRLAATWVESYSVSAGIACSSSMCSPRKSTPAISSR